MTNSIFDLLSDDLLNNFDFHFNNFSRSSTEPEKNMMIAILILGIADYLHAKQRDQEDAYQWIFGVEKEEWLYSFDNICFILGINSEELRTKLQAIKNQHNRAKLSKKLKHLNPAPGNRNKITYQPRNKYEDAY